MSINYGYLFTYGEDGKKLPEKRNLTKKEIMNILEKVYSRLSSELSKQSFKTFLEYPEFKQFLKGK